MHSVVETPTFLADAKMAGMSQDEREALVVFIAGSPQGAILWLALATLEKAATEWFSTLGARTFHCSF